MDGLTPQQPVVVVDAADYVRIPEFARAVDGDAHLRACFRVLGRSRGPSGSPLRGAYHRDLQRDPAIRRSLELHLSVEEAMALAAKLMDAISATQHPRDPMEGT